MARGLVLFSPSVKCLLLPEKVMLIIYTVVNLIVLLVI